MFNEYNLPLSDDVGTMIHEVGSSREGAFCVDETRLLSVLEKYLKIQDMHSALLDEELKPEKDQDKELIDRLHKTVYAQNSIAFQHRWSGISYNYDKIINKECGGAVAIGLPRFCEYYKKVILEMGRKYGA